VQRQIERREQMAIQNGFETRFTTATELIEDLHNASKQGHLQESLATYTYPHVLVKPAI
jgi:DNA replication protein DnaC